MGVQIPGAAPSGSGIVLLLAVGLAIALPIVAVIAMLVAQAPSPTDGRLALLREWLRGRFDRARLVTILRSCCRSWV